MDNVIAVIINELHVLEQQQLNLVNYIVVYVTEIEIGNVLKLVVNSEKLVAIIQQN